MRLVRTLAAMFACCVFTLPLSAQTRWEVLCTLTEPRAMHGAIALQNDQVLVIGGRTSDTQTSATTELIDVVSGVVTPGPLMATPRSQFALVKVPDGRVVVAGGYTKGYESNTDLVEVLDPQSMKWITVGKLVEARGQVSAIAVDDHRILVVGGRVGQSDVRSTSEMFDIKTGVSSRVQDFPYPTEGTRLIKNANGEILAFSGRSGGPGSFRSRVIHRFNVTQQLWERAGYVADSLYLPVITALDDGGYLWTGGSFRESDSKATFSSTICSLIGNSFVKIGDMQVHRVQHACTQVSDSVCVATGGQDDWQRPQLTTDLINVLNGSSKSGPSMNVPRSYHTQVDVTLAGVRSAIVIGGFSDESITPLVEILRDGCLLDVDAPLLDISSLNFVGSAVPVLGVARLTSSQQFQAGAIWLRSKSGVGKGFVTTFVFRFSQGNDNTTIDGGSPGADGVAFVILNEAVMRAGAQGGGIGYEGLPHGVAVEFDSFLNGSKLDLSGSHVAVQAGDGVKLSADHVPPFLKAMTYEGVPSFVANGTLYYAKIEYAKGLLRVWIDTDGSFKKPVVTVPIDLSSVLSLPPSGEAWLGITSSTGQSMQLQEVVAWQFGECEFLLTGLEGGSIQNEDQTINVWPLPASHRINLTWPLGSGPQSINVYSLTGVELQSSVVDSPADSQMTLDLSGLTPGIYVLSLNWHHKTQKVIIPVVK